MVGERAIDRPPVRDIRRLRSAQVYWLAAIVAVCCAGLGGIRPAMAHGTDIGVGEAQAVEIHARFDNGEVMVNAQVAVYAPDEPGAPWMTGTANDDGYFAFVPDHALPGRWDVQVRTAGHGDWVYVDVADDGNLVGAPSEARFSTGQILLMSAAVIWGLIGTALYFSRPKQENESAPQPDDKTEIAQP